MGMVYIKIFTDYLEAIEPLGDAERGRLFTALLEYAKTGEASQLGGNERFIFPIMKAQIDRDAADLNELRKKRSDSGKLGGRPKKTEEDDDLFENDEKQKKQMLFSKSKKSKDKDKDNRQQTIDKDEKGDAQARKFSPSLDCAAVQGLYNEMCPSLPKCVVVTEARRRAVAAILKKYTADDLKDVFKKAESSAFLRGENDRKWTANFDWLLKEANFVKVFEGRYSNKDAKNVSFDLDEFFELAAKGGEA